MALEQKSVENTTLLSWNTIAPSWLTIELNRVLYL